MPRGPRAFWNSASSTLVPLSIPANGGSSAVDMNNRNDILWGGGSDALIYLVSGGQTTRINEPSGPNRLLGICNNNSLNDAGQVVGQANPPSYSWLLPEGTLPFAFVWQDGSTYKLYNQLQNRAGWLSLDDASAINKHGEIVGTGKAVDGTVHGFLLRPIAARISISKTDGGITIQFTGTIESADQVSGPYSPVVGATNPFTVTPNIAARFYIVH